MRDTGDAFKSEDVRGGERELFGLGDDSIKSMDGQLEA